jgi:hypothetical protein
MEPHTITYQKMCNMMHVFECFLTCEAVCHASSFLELDVHMHAQCEFLKN